MTVDAGGVSVAPVPVRDRTPVEDESVPTTAQLAQGETRWVEVLVDCPGAEGLFTYALPDGLTVQPGDILSVPFGAQQVGAIAVQCPAHLPPDLEASQVRAIAAVIQAGFFPPAYWQLLQRVAEYYQTPLIQVVRVALPTGLLARSQRRIRLLPAPVDPPPLSAPASAILTLLQSSKTQDYSSLYLQRQVTGANRAIAELVQAGWVQSYLEPPTPPRPKLRQAVSLVPGTDPTTLAPRQQEILKVLTRLGGEQWLTDLVQQCQTSSSSLKTLERKGYVTLYAGEVLRSERPADCQRDLPKALTADQAQAIAHLHRLTHFHEVLLHGVTGSGKTEVYLQAIAPRLAQGHSTLVLVPEIGLTPQLTDRFRARFGDRVRVYHSALADGERYDTWRQMLQGQPQVVIGTRSAVFAPLPNLGLIILDEEHDSSFKQTQPAPCYHARTVARWRATLADCPLILGSATPSLETWVYNAPHASPTIPDPPRYLALPQRVQAQPLPRMTVVDMRQELHRGNRSVLSQSLQAALTALRDRREQGILFVPRRGHSSFVSCRSCGTVITCPHCDVSLTYHQPAPHSQPLLRCHYCNHVQVQPPTCPTCDSSYFKYFGSGTQRVMQELAEQFPDLRVLRFDSDTTRTKGAHRSLLARFAAGEADLLVGTQMLTKGIDIAQVTLVGIVAADGLLHRCDYSASEQAFQVLTQVAGRCGRGQRPGQVMLQTYSPDNPVIQALCRQDYAAFASAELHQRASLHYPPYGRLILYRFASPQAVAVQQAAERVAIAVDATLPPGAARLGPAPATILRVAGRFRWQVLVKYPAGVGVTLPAIAELRALCAKSVSLTVDVDPIAID